jgi:hypothetical protein
VRELKKQWWEIVLVGGGGLVIGVEWASTAKQAIFQRRRKIGMVADMVANPRGRKLPEDLRRRFFRKKKNSSQLNLDL